MIRTLAATIAFLLLLSAGVTAGDVFREPGAIYLEDLPPGRNVELALETATPSYYGPDFQRYLGTLRAGQKIVILAFSNDGFKIRGRAQQGQVAGWVPQKSLPGIAPEFLRKARLIAERQARVQDLIANKEVGIGMTMPEVQASLGNAVKKASRADVSGRSDVWDYVKYERVPRTITGVDRNNQLVQSVIYEQIPVGSLSVVFSNNLVTAIEQNQTNTRQEGGVKIVVPPIELF